MIGTAEVLWAIAAVVGAIAWSRGGGRHLKGFEFALGQFLVVFPRLILALITAGFVSTLVPAELVATWLGGDSGLRGLLIATAIGAVMPGGPVIVYPVAVALSASGAGVPQLVAFLTAWSIFAVHRVVLYELSLVGWRFTALRFASSGLLPIVAGLLAGEMPASWLLG